MRLTTLKLRTLKSCDSTARMLRDLPNVTGLGPGAFQFDVQISTDLWKSIIKRKSLVNYRRSVSYSTEITLNQATPTLPRADGSQYVDSLSVADNVHITIPQAVRITPVNAELFDRYDIGISRAVVLFRSPSIVNVNVLGTIGNLSYEAIFDVHDFPEPITDRPEGPVVSYIIDIKT